MLIAGITGGIGSGKTTVCRLFEKLGVPVYYADDAAKQMMQTDPALMHSIREQFGEDIYQQGILDRQKLAQLVFQNKEKLQTLNALVHPAVAQDRKNWIKKQCATYALVEAALLVESGFYRKCDLIALVYAPVSMRMARVMKRDAATEKQVLGRMQNQLSDEEKLAKCHFILHNDGKHSLIEQVLNLHQCILKHA